MRAGATRRRISKYNGVQKECVLSPKLANLVHAVLLVPSLPSCSPLPPPSIYHSGPFYDCFPEMPPTAFLPLLGVLIGCTGPIFFRFPARFLLAPFSSSCQVVINLAASFTTPAYHDTHFFFFAVPIPNVRRLSPVEPCVAPKTLVVLQRFSQFHARRPRPGSSPLTSFPTSAALRESSAVLSSQSSCE